MYNNINFINYKRYKKASYTSKQKLYINIIYIISKNIPKSKLTQNMYNYSILL